jgi:hypothetical protein
MCWRSAINGKARDLPSGAANFLVRKRTHDSRQPLQLASAGRIVGTGEASAKDPIFR